MTTTTKTKPGTTSKAVIEAVNKQIANLGVLYIKIHNYHWFVKGKHFIPLHQKFQELYELVGEQLDELAERLLAVQGAPIATMKEMLAIASVKEAAGHEGADDMVRTLAADFRTMIGELREGIELSEEAGDHTTADMLTGMQAELEKQAWMLDSSLD
ncbi:Dps family protein [Paenibacillus flagellatus]|uniref:DNA starvation/stationary phase protection protein n=1 Tax=Paenibacillus flagellatus TaxID=2211139 RepID=A0A2V5KFG0_9BACL|nr:DNA starvation/stationary phase protection protein [Paenibacillus flagellatus]PYI57184.1 DNA starvation/stationary phase protection protein [Paenibacillus flagellatus]